MKTGIFTPEEDSRIWQNWGGGKGASTSPGTSVQLMDPRAIPRSGDLCKSGPVKCPD